MKKQKGFTLVELLVVIAILAILATVSIVGYTSFIKKAKVSNATVELTQIRDLMIAADIDDSVKYTVGTGNDAKEYRTNLYGNETGETTNLVEAEAVALWNKVSADCEGLKGTLSFKDGTLYYVLDDAKVSYTFGTDSAIKTNDVTVPEGAVQINTAE